MVTHDSKSDLPPHYVSRLFVWLSSVPTRRLVRGKARRAAEELRALGEVASRTREMFIGLEVKTDSI